MNSSQLLENGGSDSGLEKARAAMAAGLIYFAFLAAVGVLFEVIIQEWLVPQVGDATGLVAGLTVMFPCAWLTNWFVTRQFGVESPWPQGAIVACTALVMLVVADLLLLDLLDPLEASTILKAAEGRHSLGGQGAQLAVEVG